MADLAKFNFKLSQFYPGAGDHHINTCGNPDCSNFGQPLTTPAIRRSEAVKKYPNITPEQIRLFEECGPGAYSLSGARKKYRRVSNVFEYENDPHVWSDQRTVKCLGQTRDGKACGSKFSILSPDHLNQEVERLRNQNAVLDGPACGACGTRLFDDPDQFALDGMHERSKDHAGKPIRQKKTPTSLRVLHKPCRGKKGARFSVSLPHAGQKTTANNLRILGAVLNSAGIVDIQRMIGTASTGKKIGMSRIYDRIAWLEGEWNARKHEGPKRRLWRKIHIGIDEETLEIRTIEVTSSSIGDAPMLPDLLNQIPPDQELGSVTADGAYDTRKCHDAIAARNAHAVIPPRKNAKLWKPDTPGARARNEAVRFSKYLGRALWRQVTGYHRTSRVETKMHCVKLLGQRLSARDFDRQVAEIQIRAAILNGFTALGIPRTVTLG